MSLPNFSHELQVRPMQPEERQRAQWIGARAFNKDASAWYIVDRSLVGLNPQGKMVCCLETYSAPLWWGQALLPSRSVGGVATDPDEQKLGYAGGLMVEAMHLFREQGCVVSPLWPFSFAYYRKYGWELTCPDMLLKAWPDMIRRIAPAAENIRTAVLTDLPAIQSIQTACAKRMNCQSQRPSSWWTERAGAEFPHQCLVHLDQNGAIDGYALYCDSGRWQAQGRYIHVVELQGLELPAETMLVRALAEIPNAADIDILLPADSLIPLLFPDRIVVERPQRLQLRVLDIAKALECLKPPVELQSRLAFEVEDWVVGGDRLIAVTAEVENGAVAVTAGVRGEALRCTINTFSRLFSGGLRVDQARRLGLANGGGPALDQACNALLATRTPFRGEKETG